MREKASPSFQFYIKIILLIGNKQHIKSIINFLFKISVDIYIFNIIIFSTYVKTYKKEVGNLRSLNKKEIYLIMMDEYEKRREKEIKREMYYICENITLLKKRLVVLREELLSLGDNKDKELENGKVKKLTYKRKKYQNNRKEHFE